MKHLFKKNMIHRDIKPQNILIKKYKKDNLVRKVYKVYIILKRYLILAFVEL
jgi:serine/threonine protein kinase